MSIALSAVRLVASGPVAEGEGFAAEAGSHSWSCAASGTHRSPIFAFSLPSRVVTLNPSKAAPQPLQSSDLSFIQCYLKVLKIQAEDHVQVHQLLAPVDALWAQEA